MPKKLEPYWICTQCHKPLIKVGGKSVKLNMLKHRETCTGPHPERAGYYIMQITQGKANG